MKRAVQSVEVSFHAHATEDSGKVTAAVGRALGISGEPEAQELEGHFGNKIVQLRHHLTGDDAQAVFRALATKMSASAKEELKRELQKSLDEHSSLYLRLDKQAMMHGDIVLGSSDPVRVKVKPRLFQLKEGAFHFFSEAMGLET